MLIIGFTSKTSKILPHVLCRKWRHCAPILTCPNDGTMIMYQFVRRGKIAQIKLHLRDIKLLHAAGWRFIYLPITPQSNFTHGAWTCVDMTKRAIGISAPFVKTPNALYKKLIAHDIPF